MRLCQGFRLLFDANIPGAIMHGGGRGGGKCANRVQTLPHITLTISFKCTNKMG